MTLSSSVYLHVIKWLLHSRNKEAWIQNDCREDKRCWQGRKWFEKYSINYLGYFILFFLKENLNRSSPWLHVPYSAARHSQSVQWFSFDIFPFFFPLKFDEEWFIYIISYYHRPHIFLNQSNSSLEKPKQCFCHINDSVATSRPKLHWVPRWRNEKVPF